MLIGLVGILILPVHVAFGYLGWSGLRIPHLLGTVALLGFLALAPSLMPRWLATALLALALASMLIVRLGFFGLVEFSGAGFTSEVFIHLEPTSFVVAWEQYRALCLLLFAALASTPFLAWALVRGMPRLPRARAWALAIVALACAGWTHASLPEWMLASEARAWYGPKALDLPEEELQRWRESGLIEIDLPSKSAISARPANPPRNLILVYLESLGQRVIDHPDYPGLMPNLARRMQSNSLLHDYFTASFITIEGITNSQCGTLFPFERGSDSLAGYDGMAEEQACLGDVLHRAGYAQTYLGGAETSFAGKGRFLSMHGYDRVFGFDEWQEKGLASRPGGWGLGDPDLFEQAVIELERLRADGRPFNLTLLTIGTHLPGFSYEECDSYGSDEQFIEALHCTDQLLESFLARIEADGHLDDSVVVVTADHHVFPNPQMKRLFGEDAIEDRRLPLVVLDKQMPMAKAASGAGFDLAPTLLDLLGIDTNARFALGRSLLRPDSGRDYFPTRYRDMFQGNRITPADGACDKETPSPPLSSCEKDALLTVLRMQNTRFSLHTSTQLDCAVSEGIRIQIPDAEGKPIRFLINGENQADRFTWNARAGQQNERGLFIAGFSPEGELLDRIFVREHEADGMQALPSIDGASQHLVAWRSGRGVPPPWLADQAVVHVAAAIDAHGRIHHLPRLDVSDGAEFVLAPEACTLWQDESIASEALERQLDASMPNARRLDADSPFCPVLQWGPAEVFAGERFNPQPDGSSAFWLKSDCAPRRAMLRFDGRLIETVRRLPTLTAALNADAYLMQEGEWPLELYDPDTRQHLPLGMLRVLPARSPVELPTPPSPTWPEAPARIQPPVLIAHAGGALHGRTYLNSLEALSHNYGLGHRVFKLDFSWTSDGELVLIHDWEKTWRNLFPQADHAAPPDRETFLRAAMVDGQTPLDLSRLRDWMLAHPDAWIVADINGQIMLALQMIKARLGDVQGRIIPQMHHAYRYPEIRALGYEQVIFSLYGTSLDTESLLDFVRGTPLFAVALDPEQHPDAAQLMAALAQARTPVYVHTFNEPGDLARFREQGAHGLYTDSLYLGKDGKIASQ